MYYLSDFWIIFKFLHKISIYFGYPLESPQCIYYRYPLGLPRHRGNSDGYQQNMILWITDKKLNTLLLSVLKIGH